MASDAVQFLEEQTSLQGGIEFGCLNCGVATFGEQGASKAQQRGGHHAEVVG